MAPQADDLRARQPDAGDPARGGARGAQRRHRRHRPHRLPEPGQQRPVLSVHLPRRARLGATTITIEMEIAAVHAIAELAQAEQSEVVAAAYAGATLSFGPEYLIPKPFDPRLMMRIAPAVAKAAAESRRRAAADRRHGGLPRQAADLRLRVGHDDAADLQPRQGGAEEARRLRRGRGRARAARGAGGGRREPGAADADRPARR